jgi:hypothetical protein
VDWFFLHESRLVSSALAHGPDVSSSGTDDSRNVFFDLTVACGVILTKNRGNEKRTNKKPYFLYY